MKYSDLVKFEPIESVIQLEQANSPAAVRQLVQTFVISKAHGRSVVRHRDPQPAIRDARRQQGRPHRRQLRHRQEPLAVADFRVGRTCRNGKVVKDKEVAKAAKAISGKFKVVRLELPATKKSLRNIICGRLEDFMSNEGMSFSFPCRRSGGQQQGRLVRT